MPITKRVRFFDETRKVLNAMDRKTAKVLARTGIFARKVIRRRMRPAGKKSKRSRPGEAPRVHEGLIKRLTFFAVDPRTKSVVAGPIAFRTKNPPINRATGVEVLEKGGTIRIPTSSGAKTGRVRPRPIAGPVMGDALDIALELFETIPLSRR